MATRTLDKPKPKGEPLNLSVMTQPPGMPVLAQNQVLPDGSPALVGRSGEALIQLQDPAVSRRHALLRLTGSGWEVEDLGSRHGTKVNGIDVLKGAPMPLATGDRLALGGWVLKIRVGQQQSRSGSTLMTQAGGAAEQVRAMQDHELGGLAKRRLDVLMRSAEGFTAARSIEDLAQLLAEAASDGTGCERAIVVRTPDESGEVEVLGARGSMRERLSRSLLSEAAKGSLALLIGTESPQNIAHSLVELDIRSALCVPIRMGESVEALLYLDARGNERGLSEEAASYCGALARLAGLSMANVQRAALEKHQRAVQAELDAARTAQRNIMPEPRGEAGPVRYALESEPGRVVAGDLFDVVPLDEHRTAVLLGDVTGKGVAAAMLMTSTQSFLRASLRADPDPARAVELVNRHLVPRIRSGHFVTLWLGVFDGSDRSVTFVDAGHGHCVFVSDQGTRELLRGGGLPLGLDDDTDYQVDRTKLIPGERVCLFSDGLVEQAQPGGEMFGSSRVKEILGDSLDVADDVVRLRDAVHAFAAGATLSDDLTIASIDMPE
ncbi:MAG: SpoIIE family protein phosphatase [Planctomycetota bacterium]